MDLTTTRNWLPAYCHTGNFLPTVQETIILMAKRPYFFPDFVGRAIAWLQTAEVRQLGFTYEPATTLPCKWKCSDESLFGVDLALYAFTGHYPFDKGKIGGQFNEAAVGAAVHHCPVNVDFGGSHVGYIPGPDGGTFGYVQRPLNNEELSTDCGAVMAIMAPFKKVYDDACRSILLNKPEERVLVSVPNEFLQPSWSGERVKLLVDIEHLTAGLVPYDENVAYTHKLAGRSLFYASERFLESISTDSVAKFSTPEKRRVADDLTAQFFHIFDSDPELEGGDLKHRFLPYMKYILSSRHAPYPIKAAVTRANIEHNAITDCVRAESYRPYSFACFTGVFIDMFDPSTKCYVNLFQPVGASLKIAGRTREYEFSAAEIHERFDAVAPAESVLPLSNVLACSNADRLVESFTFQPKSASRPSVGQSRRW